MYRLPQPDTARECHKCQAACRRGQRKKRYSYEICFASTCGSHDFLACLGHGFDRLTHDGRTRRLPTLHDAAASFRGSGRLSGGCHRVCLHFCLVESTRSRFLLCFCDSACLFFWAAVATELHTFATLRRGHTGSPNVPCTAPNIDRNVHRHRSYERLESCRLRQILTRAYVNQIC